MLAFQILALCSVATAAVLPRTKYYRAGACCFNLQDSSTGEVARFSPSYNNVVLGGTSEVGVFCIDFSDGHDTLYGHGDNACIADYYNQFQCLDPIRGSDKWELKKINNQVTVVNDGSTSFLACPKGDGTEEVYIRTSTVQNCRAIKLVAQNRQGTCGSFA